MVYIPRTVSFALISCLSLSLGVFAESAQAGTVIPNEHPLIFYHGRWDTAPGTWWAGSGIKLNVRDLTSLSLNLGRNTTVPSTSVGVSLNFEPFVTVNISEGVNVIPLRTLTEPRHAGRKSTVVRITTEGWQNNRMNLESIVLNPGAELVPYTPSRLTFQVIGDSLSAGQYLDEGVLQAWPVLTAESFKAELDVNAQPGAALKDIPAWGNVHGVSFEFFRTEDTGFYYTTDHNYTTPWNFARDKPSPTHVIIHIGANDASQNVTATDFEQTYLDFVSRLRTLYPSQPIFVFTPWGWPNADGAVGQYYEGSYQKIVETRHMIGDKNVFLVNTTGWVGWEDVFPTNQHPTAAGHAKIAGLLEAWLENWGLRPESSWPTQV